MKDADDIVLYIGKAKNLRSRVSSYFQPSSNLEASRGPNIVEMVDKVDHVDYLEAESEVDAMLKEARLIKDVRPLYNMDLMDDKTFPYLEITIREDFPGVYITRKPHEKGTLLFGPFTNVSDLRGVLVELEKIFKFRTCTLDIREDDPNRRFFRPCLLHNINQCTAPCGARIEQAGVPQDHQGLRSLPAFEAFDHPPRAPAADGRGRQEPPLRRGRDAPRPHPPDREPG